MSVDNLDNKQQNRMNKSNAVMLELVMLRLADRFKHELLCSISLMKGMQSFGEIKFKIDQAKLNYEFSQEDPIFFGYAPRLTSRRDTFFRIILTDVQSKQQLGDIPISTHLLAETFTQDPKAIIQDTKQFLNGVSLSFKIYQPIALIPVQQMPKHERKVSIKLLNSENNQYEVERQDNMKERCQDSLNSQKQTLQISISAPHQSPSHPQKSKKSMQKVPFLTSIARHPIPITQSRIQQHPIPPSASASNPPIATQAVSPSASPDNQLPEYPTTHLMMQTFKFVREQAYMQHKQKHTLSKPNMHDDHHHKGNGLSNRIKIVLFLLLFGILMTFYDIYQDKQEIREIRRAKLDKNKNKKSGKK